MSRLTLALDAMGGDFGPSVTVPAALQALERHPNLSIQMFGLQTELEPYSRELFSALKPRIQFIDAPDVVGMDERPAYVLRHRRCSSMRLAIDAVAEGRAMACVSAGNTGALMAMAKLVIKTLPGIERPALISTLPSRHGGKVQLLDLGANINCDSETLFQFALMGHVKSQQVDGLGSPRVALLNVGEEAMKGNDVVRSTATLLTDCPEINYVGFIEGHDLFSNRADVVVCDGFVGNVCLKTCEGLSKFFIDGLKQSLRPRWLTKLLVPLLQPQLARLMNGMNPDQYNGASLLGLRGIVVKSHGNANLRSFGRAIDEAVIEMQRRVPEQIKDRLEAVLL